MEIYDKNRRSLAAKEGWKTRRVNKLKAGKLTWEDFENIYGEYSFQLASEKGYDVSLLFDEYYSEEPKLKYNSPEIDEITEDEDRYYLTMYEISNERIQSTLASSAYNVYNSVNLVLTDIKNTIDPQDYKKFFVEALPELDEYLGIWLYPWDMEEPTNNVISKITELARPYGFDKTSVEYSEQVHQLVQKDIKDFNDMQRTRRAKAQKRRRSQKGK